MPEVFITRVGAFLPGDAIDNEAMGAFVSELDQGHKVARRMTLRNSRIKQRYYALDPKDGSLNYSNAQMTAHAIRSLADERFALSDIDLVACGSSTPDQLLPSHTSMVHGELKNPSCEIASFSGVCCTGVAAMKYGFLSVLSGQKRNAVATGSELVSSYLTDKNFTLSISGAELDELHHKPIYAFESAFLRWMLSDGAGAVLMQSTPRESGLSLKVEWIEVISYADRYDACMYAGAQKQEDGSLKGWREYDLNEGNAKTLFAIKQDVKLLNNNMTRLAVEEHLKVLKEKYGLQAETIDHFFPHLSSNYFKNEVYDYLKKIGMEIPFEKWFTNLSYVGNVGSASIYMMLEEAFNRGIPTLDDDGLPDPAKPRRMLQRGETILCAVPESGRFSNAFMLLKVV